MVIRYRLHPHGEKVFDANICDFVDDSPLANKEKGTIRILSTITRQEIRKPSLFEKIFQGKKDEIVPVTYEKYTYHPIYIVEENGNYFEPFTKTKFVDNGWVYAEGECLTIPGVRKQEWVAYAQRQYWGDGMWMGNCPLAKNKEIVDLANNFQYKMGVQAYFDALRKISEAEQQKEQMIEEKERQKQRELESIIKNL